MRSGKYERKAMRASCVSEDDLAEDLRLSAEIEEIKKVKVARLERSGDLSFIVDKP